MQIFILEAFRQRLLYSLVKASETAVATGYAHNHSIIFVTLHNNNYYFCIIVRGRFMVWVGVGLDHNLIGRNSNFIVNFLSELYPF